MKSNIIGVAEDSIRLAVQMVRKRKMRIAFIMLCHKNPEQINRLIDKLSEFSDADIYIHVDMKHSEIREQIKTQDNVILVPENRSFRIQWGSVDIVRATLQLIREVRESANQYDYIWLVSGQDYPICPVAEIEKRLSERVGINYIECITSGHKQYDRYKKLYEVAYPSWINGNNLVVKSIKRIYMILTGGYRYTFPLFVRRKPFDFDFSFGSQWWTLTSAAAFEILEYNDRHPEILKYYEKSIIPDESFFQTIFMRGPYRNKKDMNLTFVNWGKNRRNPEVLTFKNAKMLKEVSKTYCFARKFDKPQSNSLIDYIEEMTDNYKIKVLEIVPAMNVDSGVASYIMNYLRLIDHDSFKVDFALFNLHETPYFDEIKKYGGKIFLLPEITSLKKHYKLCKLILDSGEYDIVHDNTLMNSIPLMAEAKRQNVPIRILHSHNSKLGETRYKEIRNKLLLPFLKNTANNYAACSGIAAKALFGKKPYYLIPNIIQENRFLFSEEIRRAVRDNMNANNKVLIGTVGRMSEQKNPFFALDVISELVKTYSNFEYWWIGSGPLDEKFQLRIRALGLDKYVKALGRREDVVDLYNAMDIFFLPSKFEGFGIVGVEAQAMGLPCVMSDVVPREAVYTDLVEYVSLQEPIEKWIKVIRKQMERISVRRSYSKELASSDFSSAHAGERLEAYYKRLMGKAN